MQSAMQMFVARFASKDPRIRVTTDAKGYLSALHGWFFHNNGT